MSESITSKQKKQLIQAAMEVRLKAYAPYSQFFVGAALLAEDGLIYSGCNVENAAYPEGTCAEAGAIAAMIAGGARKIVAIAVVGSGERLVSPCGGCRQKIAEFSGELTPVLLSSVVCADTATYTIGELLPESFLL